MSERDDVPADVRELADSYAGAIFDHSISRDVYADRIARAIMADRARSALADDASSADTEPLTFSYTNWRGETSTRHVRPIRIWYGSTEWHSKPGWMLTAYDFDKGAERDFAMADMGSADALAQAYQEGAKAMRERAAQVASRYAKHCADNNGLDLSWAAFGTIAAVIRALDTPEPQEGEE